MVGDAEFVGYCPWVGAVEHFGLPVFVLGDEEVGGEPVCSVFLWCAHSVSQADLFAVVVVPAGLACPVVGDVHT